MSHPQLDHRVDDVLVVERHGIEGVGDEERHGKSSSQGTLWFAANMSFVPILLGSFAISFGLGFWESVIVFVVANVLGALGNSLAVAMGPRMGMPQMPISRSAFGYRGAYIPAFLATLLFIGYFATGVIVGAITFQSIWPVSYTLAAIVLGLLSIVVTVVGYNLVHRLEWALTGVSFVVFAILSILAIVHGLGPHSATTSQGTAHTNALLLEFTIIFSYTVSWAPYAADFSRYLPRSVPLNRPFLWSFVGMALSVTWLNILGTYLATLIGNGGALAGISTIGSGFAYVAFAVIVLGSLSTNVLNAYSAAMSGMTWDFPLRRIQAVMVFGVIGTILSVAFGGAAFQATLEKFLFLVVYFITPWLAIVATDFFILNRVGKGYPFFPSVREFYRSDGVFGAIKWSGVLAFVIGIGLSVPFMATVLYTGPIGNALGGADFSYFVSAVIAICVYYGAETWRRSHSRAIDAQAVPAVRSDVK